MVPKPRHSKNIPYTDEEINKYCVSVEKLLMKIKEDSLAKKRRKVRAVQAVAEEEHITEEEDDLVLS